MRFDDEPPPGWVYWTPGENRVVGHDEQVSKRWSTVRASRDALLTRSDWVVTRSSERGEPTPPQWGQYRQALRDITGQADPFSIVWPVAPA